MGDLSGALAKGKELTFAGQTWHVSPLDFNDLCTLEEEIGDLASLDISKLKHQREILWLTLRKADPTLPTEYRNACKYKLSKEDVGAMLTADELKKPDTGKFLLSVLRMSGILPAEDAPQETEDPNEPAETTPPSDAGSADTSTFSSSGADGPTSKPAGRRSPRSGH